MSAFFDKVAINKALKEQREQREHAILVVDDEVHNLTTLSDILIDQFEIFTAQDGD